MTGGWTRRQFSKRGAAAALSGAALSPALARGARAAPKAKVVVIGGGPGGATAARSLAEYGGGIDVTLVEPKRRYTTCFFSNLHLAGLRSLESITQGYETLAGAYGIKVVHDRAAAIDPAKKTVRLAGGTALSYDRLIVAPGVELLHDSIEGYSEAASRRMPHAWSGGDQHRLLRDQLLAMEDGGTFLIAPPAEPYRCPPGPYERASMVAHYLKRHKPRSRIVILDAKDKFSKQKLFEDGWLRFYEDMIEWLPAEFTGGLASVDPKTMTVRTEDETLKVAVANVIPPQRAGRIAQATGLADETGWCPVDPATLASRLQPDIHVLGDAIIGGDMPKSAFAAGSQAKVCAMAVRAALTGAEVFAPRFLNTCWSFIAENHAVKVGGYYRAGSDKIAKVESYISAAEEDDAQRAVTAREAAGWYAATLRDIFGEAA